MDLRQRLAERKSGVLLFGLTPPRVTATPDDMARIAQVTLDRLEPLGLDGLVLYDIDDESDRNPDERPFPFMPTVDPAIFLNDHLKSWGRPVVMYRSVGKYAESELDAWLQGEDAATVMTVFVGPSTGDKDVRTSLPRAHELWRTTRPDLLLGGVAIPERHDSRGDEHLRMARKQLGGCSFFVTQVVYDLNAAKSLVSDYHYACAEEGIEPVPVIFTFSVCGSLKTLEFLEWLGVSVPRWVRNELVHTGDTLAASYELALDTARELVEFCERLGVPYGFNVESVSIRKVEIEASTRLAGELGTLLGR